MNNQPDDGVVELGAMTNTPNNAADEFFDPDFDPGDFNDYNIVEEETSPLADRVPPESFIPLRFVDVVVILPNTNPIMILEEFEAPHRQLRIPIGAAEGTAIAYGAKEIATPKPLTHELFVDSLRAFDITIEVVRITAVEGNAFVAEIIFSSMSGQRTLACRPSDGVALALRQGLVAPIVAAPDVLDQVGFEKSGVN